MAGQILDNYQTGIIKLHFRSQIPLTPTESMYAKYTGCVIILHNHVYLIYTCKSGFSKCLQGVI